MVVVVDNVQVSSLIDAYVDELVSVVHVLIRIIVDLVVGECHTAVYRDADPDGVDVTGNVAPRKLGDIVDRTEHLIDQMVVRIYCQVTDDIVEASEDGKMVCVECTGGLCKSCPLIIATIDYNVAGSTHRVV